MTESRTPAPLDDDQSLARLIKAQETSGLSLLQYTEMVYELGRRAALRTVAVPAERVPCANCTSDIYCEMNGCKRASPYTQQGAGKAGDT